MVSLGLKSSDVREEIAEAIGISSLFPTWPGIRVMITLCVAVQVKSLAGASIFDETPACFALTLGNGQFNAASIEDLTENIIPTAYLQDQALPCQVCAKRPGIPGIPYSTMVHGHTSPSFCN